MLDFILGLKIKLFPNKRKLMPHVHVQQYRITLHEEQFIKHTQQNYSILLHLIYLLMNVFVMFTFALKLQSIN